MEITLGEKGLHYTWQKKFDKETTCCRCGGKARIGFVAHEGMTGKDRQEIRDSNQYVCDLHPNEGGENGDFWLHDCCVVAVYFCKKCLEPTALYNQG